MTTYRTRWEELARAYGLLLDLSTDEFEAAGSRPATPHEQRVEYYAARIAAGLPLNPDDSLTGADKRGLALCGRRRGKGGRTPLAKKTHLPFARRLNKDCRRSAALAAKRFKGGEVPVPAVVRLRFPDEPDLARKWSDHVRSLARPGRTR